MSELADKIVAARAEVQRLELEAAHADAREKAAICAAVGHSWRHIGGCNAGCGEDCACSVPVHECTCCGDCDYGENAEAETVRFHCRAAA